MLIAKIIYCIYTARQEKKKRINRKRNYLLQRTLSSYLRWEVSLQECWGEGGGVKAGFKADGKKDL